MGEYHQECPEIVPCPRRQGIRVQNFHGSHAHDTKQVLPRGSVLEEGQVWRGNKEDHGDTTKVFKGDIF